MYTLDLICSLGHVFEGWFSNREAFECQRDGNLISCPSCNDTKIQQTLTPVRIKKHVDAPMNATVPRKPAAPAIMQYIEKHFEDVGKEFTNEALKIHYGDAEHKNIRGTATPEEEKTLADEGVSFFKLPEFQ